jgi:hypothetical protein
LRWRTKIEEFLLYLHYIKGEKNVLADNLSPLHRLPTLATLAKGKKLVEPAEVTDDEGFSGGEAFFLEHQLSGMYDCTIRECLECYLIISLKLTLLRKIP